MAEAEPETWLSLAAIVSPPSSSLLFSSRKKTITTKIDYYKLTYDNICFCYYSIKGGTHQLYNPPNKQHFVLEN